MTRNPFDITVDRVPQLNLGATTLRVGAIGFGCMGLTGVYNIENRDDKRSEAAVNRALDLKMSYLDTADSFGPYGNEKFLGKILEWRRSEAVVTTKVGVTGRADGTYHHNARPEHIRQAVDDSLRRLRCGHIDVYLLQAIDPSVPAEESWGAMAELVSAGKVRTLGVRTDDVSVLTRLQRVFPVTVATTELSYWEQANLPMVSWTAERGIAFVASSPLGRGFLTGSISPNRTFPWTDLRSKLPKFKLDAIRREAAVLEPLRTVGRAHGVRPGQVALAWLLHQGANVIPVPGSTDPMHVAMNAGAAHLSLTPQDLALLTAEAPDAAKRQRAQAWQSQSQPAEVRGGQEEVELRESRSDESDRVVSGYEDEADRRATARAGRKPVEASEREPELTSRPVSAWLSAALSETRRSESDRAPARQPVVEPRSSARDAPPEYSAADPDVVVVPRSSSAGSAATRSEPALDATDDGDLDALIRATSQWSYDRGQ